MDKKLSIMISMFIVLLLCGNLLGSKLIEVVGITISVGVFAYPITFLITDITEEVYGKDVAKLFIYAGIIALVITQLYILLAINIEPASFYKNAEAYNSVFGNTSRIIIASLVSFLVSQTNDVFVFDYLKKLTKGKYLWLRNNVSTIISQLIDSTLFIFIAFYKVSPAMNLEKMISMIISYFIIKIVIALLDTPFFYLGVKLLRRKEGVIE